jgi:hypothetical protein
MTNCLQHGGHDTCIIEGNQMGMVFNMADAILGDHLTLKETD